MTILDNTEGDVVPHRDASFAGLVLLADCYLNRGAWDDMVDHARRRAAIRLTDGTIVRLFDWRRNGTTMKVITGEHRHRTIPKSMLVEVLT